MRVGWEKTVWRCGHVTNGAKTHHTISAISSHGYRHVTDICDRSFPSRSKVARKAHPSKFLCLSCATSIFVMKRSPGKELLLLGSSLLPPA